MDDASTASFSSLPKVAAVVPWGPVVDVLERPRPEGSGDINIRSFGGSPFWVGQLGRAYIRGVHQGGAGRVLTIAKHFPGHGASDRLPDDEVATVNKSLGELRRSDLVPFFAITQPDPSDLAKHVASRREKDDDPDRLLVLRAFAAQSAIDWPALDEMIAADAD